MNYTNVFFPLSRLHVNSLYFYSFSFIKVEDVGAFLYDNEASTFVELYNKGKRPYFDNLVGRAWKRRRTVIRGIFDFIVSCCKKGEQGETDLNEAQKMLQKVCWCNHSCLFLFVLFSPNNPPIHQVDMLIITLLFSVDIPQAQPRPLKKPEPLTAISSSAPAAAAAAAASSSTASADSASTTSNAGTAAVSKQGTDASLGATSASASASTASTATTPNISRTSTKTHMSDVNQGSGLALVPASAAASASNAKANKAAGGGGDGKLAEKHVDKEEEKYKSQLIAFHELMVWAVLMNHHRLAYLFWQLGGW